MVAVDSDDEDRGGRRYGLGARFLLDPDNWRATREELEVHLRLKHQAHLGLKNMPEASSVERLNNSDRK